LLMNRPLLFSGLAMLVAILVCELTKNIFPSQYYIFAAVAFAFTVLCPVFLGRHLRTGSSAMLTLCLAALFAFVGCLCWFFTAKPIDDSKAQFLSTTQRVTLTLVSDPEVSGMGTSAYAESDSFAYKVRLYLPAAVRANRGDSVTGDIYFSELYNEDFYRSDRVIMYARAASDSVVTEGDRGLIGHFTDILSSHIERTSSAVFGEYSPFIESIMMGGSERLSDSRRAELRTAGLLHITCVSGLHISILISAVTLLLSRLKNQKIAFTVTVGSVLIILLLCAFSPSSVRASMTGLTMLAYGNKPYRPDGLNLLGLPMIALLLYDPLYAVDVSFLLSFSAVAGIHLFNDRIYRSLITRITAESGKIPSFPLRALAQSFALSLVCTVATAPISMIFFDSAVTASVISGVVCLWAVTPIYVFSLLCILLHPLPFTDFLVRPLAFTVKKGVSFIMNISEMLSEFDLSEIDLSGIDFSDFSLAGIEANFAMWFAIFIAAVFIILLFRPFKEQKAKTGKPGMGWILLLVAVILVGAYFLRGDKSDGVIDEEGMTVGFVDVGQGCCGVVIQGDMTAVIDCGGSEDPGEAAADFIRRYGDGEIDLVILTHLHSDHVNGLADLAAQFPIGAVYIPYTEGDELYEDQVFTVAEMMSIPIREVEEDLLINLGTATLSVYAGHLDDGYSDQNDNSLITVAELEDFSVMFTGDITSKSEGVFVDLYPFVTAEVLCVPHHGSKHSSTEDFLASVSPKLSVISVSANNSYGHPTPEAVSRLSKYGDILTTKDCGTIRIVSDGYDYEIFTENE